MLTDVSRVRENRNRQEGREKGSPETRVITCDGFHWPKSRRTRACRAFIFHSRSNGSADDLARSARRYPYTIAVRGGGEGEGDGGARKRHEGVRSASNARLGSLVEC